MYASAAVIFLLVAYQVFFSFAAFVLFSNVPNQIYFTNILNASYYTYVLYTAANYPDVEIPFYAINRANSFFFVIFLMIGVFML